MLKKNDKIDIEKLSSTKPSVSSEFNDFHHHKILYDNSVYT